MSVVEGTERMSGTQADRYLMPTSFAQERLWFLDQFEAGSPAYNIPSAFRWPGTLDLEALERSLNDVVERHEALRTTFVAVDGRPMQVITPSLRLRLPVEDLSSWPAAEREVEAGRIATREFQRPFDLSSGPLLRVRVVRMGEADHLILLTIHHIVADGWSLGILTRELNSFYEARSRGLSPALPELPIQYADFAGWQREQLQGEPLETLLSFWKEQLDNAPSLLALPTDHPRPAQQSLQGANHSFLLPRALCESLRRLAVEEGVSLFMVLVAAFQTLLYRYSRQDDILVGVPIANRTRKEVEGLIGFFTNTLVLRTRLSGDPSFRDLLQRVRETTLGIFQHQDLPFEKLVEEIQPQRSLSHHPLFQVLFVLQNLPTLAPPRAGGEDPPGGEPQGTIPFGNGSSKFDLTLFLIESEGGMQGVFEYSTDLFEAGTIAWMAHHFQALLQAVVADPGCHVSALPIASPRDYRLALEQTTVWIPFPSQVGVHALFEAQARFTPDAPAVSLGEESLSYRELDRRGNRLAHRLQALGIGPDIPVAIALDRSLEMTVGILAVLKAGGAYLPLDPDYPEQRLAYMLEDSKAPVLLTRRALAGRLPTSAAVTLCLDEEAARLQEESGDPPKGSGGPSSLAYIIYTSGSTGRPKGVAMPHGPLLNLIQWQNTRTSLGPAGRTLQYASFSFDVSFQEMFATWSSGGTLVLATEEERIDRESLLGRLRESRVERLFLPPTALSHLTEEFSEADPLPASLREVVVAGEQLRLSRSAKEFFSRLPGCTLHNQYGPTETHVVTEYVLYGPPATWPSLPPIGGPIANVAVHLLDGNLQPAPAGALGEVYVGGEALARGYLGQAARTAESFLPDPFSQRPGARLYRTGDLARLRPTGELEFAGRFDDQVKIRGFRVELGEIEASLLRHAEVRQAAAILADTQTGEKRLVAYVVTAGDSPSCDEEIRAHLRRELPEFMVPSLVIAVESLPLTPSGKLDRRHLPRPDWSRVGTPGDRRPRTWLELKLAGIWAEVLQLDEIGVDDHFFDLGGHSLLATRVTARIRDAFQVDLPLRSLFESPTIAQLAVTLAQGLASTLDPEENERILAEIERMTESQAGRLEQQEVDGG